MNGILVTDKDQLDDMLDNNPDYLDVVFIFVQADRGSNFETAKLGSFGYGVSEFFDPNTKEPRNARIMEFVEIMRAIYARSSKFKRGNPTCLLYYVTTGKVVGDASLAARSRKWRASLPR